MPVQVQKQIRCKSALARLEAQLRTKTKVKRTPNEGDLDVKVIFVTTPMDAKDIKRVEKEIQILKTKLGI